MNRFFLLCDQELILLKQLLICFLKQSLYNFTDDLIEMVDQRLWELYNQAKRNFDNDRLMASKTIDEKLKTLQDIGYILLDQNVDDNSVRVKTTVIKS